MTSEDVSPHGLQTFIHQSQLATWRVVAQSCAIFGGPSTTLNIFPNIQTFHTNKTFILFLIKKIINIPFLGKIII